MMKIGKILAMSLCMALRNGNSEEMAIVGVKVGGKYQVGYDITKNPGYYSVEKTFQQPLEVDKGDIISLQLRESSRTYASGMVALLIELEM